MPPQPGLLSPNLVLSASSCMSCTPALQMFWQLCAGLVSVFQCLSCTGQGVPLNQVSKRLMSNPVSAYSYLRGSYKEESGKLISISRQYNQGKQPLNTAQKAQVGHLCIYLLNNHWKASAALGQVMHKGCGISHLEVFKTWLDKYAADLIQCWEQLHQFSGKQDEMTSGQYFPNNIFTIL